ncbi:hypothetical protein M413DRAFT_191885 [Hebeloma cylindrosporum]|uniref:Uncharacterized protein n=1 Tax=Hebeloma cylindrosporum TaxID=76867 RepID=A0A0C2YEL9_HEBCY|nr:hypothetical protein M413DRAFT_191885 [Hebeloma cylindrosporum h7]
MRLVSPSSYYVHYDFFYREPNSESPSSCIFNLNIVGNIIMSLNKFTNSYSIHRTGTTLAYHRHTINLHYAKPNISAFFLILCDTPSNCPQGFLPLY